MEQELSFDEEQARNKQKSTVTEDNTKDDGWLESELRGLMISCTQSYLELWDLSQKSIIDIKRIDSLTIAIQESLKRVTESWELLCKRSGGQEAVNTCIRTDYAKFLIEITPFKVEGFNIARELLINQQQNPHNHQESAQEYSKSEFSSYTFHTNTIGTESASTDQVISNVTSEITAMKNNSELPQSAKALKVLGIVFLLVIVSLNSVEWHMASDSFKEHLDNLHIISSTNQLQTESMSLISYLQDIQYIAYQNVTNSNNPISEKYTIGLQESIQNIRSATEKLKKRESNTDMQAHQQRKVQAFTGRDLNETTEMEINQLQTKLLNISSRILDEVVNGNLHSFDEMFQNEDLNFVLMNAMNCLWYEQKNLYQQFISEFTDESNEVADTNIIMLIFIVFILSQIVLTLVWLIVKLTKGRQKAYKKMLKIPLEIQGRFFDACLRFLVHNLKCPSEDVLRKLKEHNDGFFQENMYNSSSRDPNVNSNNNQFWEFESETEAEESKKKLYNIMNKRVIAFTGILGAVLILYFLSNYVVQNQLATDMAFYVSIEDAQSISESSYMFADNVLHLYLLNSMLPVIGEKSSLDLFKKSVLKMNDYSEKIKNFAGEITNPPMRKAFKHIMLENPCKMIADGSEKVYTHEECEEFGDGILQQGLSKGMEKFINYSNSTSNILQVQKSLPNTSPQAGVHVDILELEEVKISRQLQRLYIKEGLLVLKESLRQIMEKQMNTFLKWKEFSWYGGLVIMIITYLQLHFNIIAILPFDILRARKSLEIIPLQNL